MSHATKRSIIRWVHILSGLPLVGFIYGPPAETEQYRYMFQFVFVPLLLLTGVWMWQGPNVRRLLFKSGNKRGGNKRGQEHF